MTSPDWAQLPDDHNLSKFAKELPGILADAEHDEMYGVRLEAPNEVSVRTVLDRPGQMLIHRQQEHSTYDSGHSPEVLEGEHKQSRDGEDTTH